MHRSLDHGLDGLVDFLAGERALGMAEGHAEVDALLLVGEVPALEGVEIVDGGEVGAGGMATAADESSAQGEDRATTRERSRTTAGNGGSGVVLGDEPGLVHQDVEFELGRGAGGPQLECRELAVIDLAQVAQVRLAQQQLGGAAGGEEGELDRAAPPSGSRMCSRASRASTMPLRPAEIAAGDQGQPRRLVGERDGRRGAGRRWRSRRARRRALPWASLCRRTASRLGIRLCRRAISRLRLEWSTRSGGGGRAGPDRGGQRLVDQAERHRLVEAQAGQQRRGPRTRPARDARAAARDGHGAVLGDVLIAVDPRHLLDQVDLALQVGPPARRPDGDRVVGSARATPAPAPSGCAGPRRRSIGIPSTRSIWASRSVIGDRCARRAADVDHARDGACRRPASRISSAQRRLAHSVISGSSGRSNRKLDGLNRPSARDVCGPTSASNCAASIRTFGRVGADLGLEAPHHARQADRAGRRRRSRASRGSARRSGC